MTVPPVLTNSAWEGSRDARIARKLAELSNEIIRARREIVRLEGENDDLKRRLKITEQFVPVQSHKSLEAALGEGGTW